MSGAEAGGPLCGLAGGLLGAVSGQDAAAVGRPHSLSNAQGEREDAPHRSPGRAPLQHPARAVQQPLTPVGPRPRPCPRLCLQHKKDFATRRGLLQILGQRKQLLSYLQREDK